MNNKPKFKKSYINPSLGYWEDKNKPIEFNQIPQDFNGYAIFEGDLLVAKAVQITHDTTDHLCIGKRCLICETRNLVL